MVLTLATNYDRVYRDLLVHLVVAPGMFILGIVFALLLSGRRWSWAFTWTVVWGLTFPFVRVFLLNVEGAAGQFNGGNTPATWAGPLYMSLGYLVVVLVVWLVRLKQ